MQYRAFPAKLLHFCRSLLYARKVRPGNLLLGYLERMRAMSVAADVLLELAVSQCKLDNA